MSVRIDATALVSSDAQLGEKVAIGPFVVIEAGVEIGDETEVRAHAVLKQNTVLGRRNQIYEAAVIGGLPQVLDLEIDDSCVRIGDQNTIREGVTIHRSKYAGGETRVGNFNFLMASSHIGHDCQVADHVVVANYVGLAGHVVVGSHAILSGQSGVHQFCQIGAYSMTGGQAKVVRDVLPYCLVDGSPARTRGLNLIGLRRHGFSATALSELKKAYRIIFSAGLRLEEKLKRLEKMTSPESQGLLEFIQRSQRGFCRASRPTDRSD